IIVLLRPREALRYLATIFGAVGLLTHTLYLVAQHFSLASQTGSFLFLGWILATFYLYGSIHHRRLAWGLFVLPVVIGLTALAHIFGSAGANAPSGAKLLPIDPIEFWRVLHIALFLL